MKFKFKDHADYENQRNELLNKAQEALKNGNSELCEQLTNDIKEMDTAYDKHKLNMANLAALEGSGAKGPAVITGSGAPAANKLTDSEEEKAKELKAKEEKYVIAFANKLQGKKLTDEQQQIFNEFNAGLQNSAQTAADHSVLIPETVKQGIWEEMGQSHPILEDLFTTNILGDVKIIKDEGDGNDADWTDEETETGDDNVALGTVNLTGCELSKNITVSWKLKNMEAHDFIAYITKKLAKKLGNAVANAVVNGKGKPGERGDFKPQPRGIVTALEAEASTPQVKTFNAAAGVKYKDITGLFALVKSGYKKVIYANSTTIWNVIANIVDSTGKPYFVADPTNAGVGRVLGAVVKEEDAVKDDGILLGDVAAGYAMNINKTMQMYSEDHVKARTTDYSGYMIADGDVLSNKAFAYLKKNE